MITECWTPQSSHRDTFFSIYRVCVKTKLCCKYVALLMGMNLVCHWYLVLDMKSAPINLLTQWLEITICIQKDSSSFFKETLPVFHMC